MSSWKTRLKTELKKLDKKITKLDNFASSPKASSLDAEDRIMLADQRSAMDKYRRVLSRRIKKHCQEQT